MAVGMIFIYARVHIFSIQADSVKNPEECVNHETSGSDAVGVRSR